jgi:nicotinate-nucleotide adenylyltransferase
MAPERLGFFGGSFDPPHYGHLLTVTYALEAGEFDTIFVVPAYRHPTKSIDTVYEHRLNMTRQTFSVLSMTGRVRVSSIEKDHNGWHCQDQFTGKVYTYNALMALRGNNGDEWRLIIGQDEVDTLKTWYKADELVKVAPPFIVPRTFSTDNQLRNHVIDASSTIIREAFKYGSDLGRELVVPSVYRYIQENGLYVAQGHS